MTETKICSECGEECGAELRRMRTDLPDWPHSSYELAWVSACCGADYDIIHEDQKSDPLFGE